MFPSWAEDEVQSRSGPSYRLVVCVELLVGQDVCVLVGAFGFVTIVVAVGDFDVLLLATVESLAFIFGGCPWFHAFC